MVVWMATFRFLGLKTSFVALANWGDMLNESRDWIIGMPSDAFAYWYTYLPPSLAIVLFSMGWGLIGDGLRNLLDPRYTRANSFQQ
jgi:peptide/nickel transport system permease protein